MVATKLQVLASIFSVISLLNPSLASHCTKKRLSSTFFYIDIYTDPFMTVEEVTAYCIVSSLPAFIGHFTYPWKPSHIQLFKVQKVPNFSCSGIVEQSGFDQSRNQFEEQNAFCFH